MRDTTFISGWTEDEQLIGNAIIKIVKNTYETNAHDPVLLTNIHFGPNSFDGIPKSQLQILSILRTLSGKCEIERAGGMDNIYKLTKHGSLYKHLRKN